MLSGFDGKQFHAWPDATINGALLIAAALLILLAFVPEHRVLKMIVLAYVFLP
jgi:hypothetical protein